MSVTVHTSGDAWPMAFYYFTHEHQKWYFHFWLRHLCIYCFKCSFGKIKIDLTLKKSNILYMDPLVEGFCHPVNQTGKNSLPLKK